MKQRLETCNVLEMLQYRVSTVAHPNMKYAEIECLSSSAVTCRKKCLIKEKKQFIMKKRKIDMKTKLKKCKSEK